MLKQEADRQTALAKAIDMARAPLPNPDRQALAHARELAKTDEEKARVRELDTAAEKHDRNVQEEADQRLYKDWGQLAERIEKLSKDKDTDLGTQEPAIARVRSDLSALDARSKDVSDAAREQLKVVWSRVTALEKAVERRKQEDTGQRAITQAVGDLARYREELARYIRESPESSRTTDLKRTLEESALVGRHRDVG